MSSIPGYLTIEEAAVVIGRSTSQLTRYCQQGKLPAKNLGRQWIITAKAAVEFQPPPRGNPNFRKNRRRKTG